MEVGKKNPSNHSFKYKLSFHANKKPPTVAGSPVEATAGEAQGGGLGQGMHTQAQLWPYCSKGAMWVDGQPGRGTGHLSGQVLGNVLLKSSVTLGAGTIAVSLHKAKQNSTGPEGGGRLLVRRLIQSAASTVLGFAKGRRPWVAQGNPDCAQKGRGHP